MTASALPIQGLIQISLTITPNAARAQNLSTALVLTNDAVIDVTERMRSYGSLTELAQDFATNSVAYQAAVPWFGQKPQPTQLNVGRWAKTATPGQLSGAVLSSAQQLIATWNAVVAGSFSIVINGVPLAITGLNFAAAANLNGVAATIQTALAAASAGATTVWLSNGSYFLLTSGTTGTASTISFVGGPRAVGRATFSGQPTALDTLTINGTAVTFVAGAPVGNQVQIGGTLTITLANLLAFLQTSVDVNLSLMQYYVVGSVLYVQAIVIGAAGNAYTLARSSAAITLSGATLAGGSGTDISAMTGLTATSSGAYLAEGIAAESALAAVQLFDDQFPGQWYGLCLPEASDSDALAIAPYIEADNISHIYGITTQEAGALVPTNTTDLPYLLSQLGELDHSTIQYSSTSAYAVMSYLGRFATVNWDGNNTALTLMYKQEPGIVAESLTTTQANALKAKNCNVFVNYQIATGNTSSTAIIQYGVQCSGNWTDLIAGCDWFKDTVQANAFTLMFSTPTKVPQTDAGMTTIATQAIATTANQGVNNGFLAPGVWNSAGFGALNEGDYMQTGFYIYQPSVNLQPQSQRQQRISVPFQVALKTAGAVQDIVIAVEVNQ